LGNPTAGPARARSLRPRQRRQARETAGLRERRAHHRREAGRHRRAPGRSVGAQTAAL